MLLALFMTIQEERDCTKPKGFIVFSAISMPRPNMLSLKRQVLYEWSCRFGAGYWKCTDIDHKRMSAG